MPIRIPDTLPARATLEAEGVMVMGENSATRQDIRPLRLGLLNLMPNKIRTLLGRIESHIRVDAHQRPFHIQHMLGSDGGGLPFSWHSKIRTSPKSVRCLSPPQPQPFVSLSERIF